MSKHTVGRRQVRKIRHRAEEAQRGKDRREVAAEKRRQIRHSRRRVVEI